MFMSLREIATARGRFALIGGVVALITLLLTMLTGLTEGLSKQNTSALDALGTEYPEVSFSTEDPDFAESYIKEGDVDADGIPLGAVQTRIGETGTAAAFGLPAGTQIPGTDVTIPAEGIVASESVQLNDAPVDTVATIPDEYFSHSLVVWASTETWQELTRMPDDVVGTVVLHTEPTADSVSMDEALSGLAAYQSERGSLLAMQGFLYGISALVIIAFLSVWTIQRERELSILAALGASAGYLFKDALAQAAIILAAGVALGAVCGAGLGALVAETVPFHLSAWTILAPAAGIWVLGMLGALVATRRVTKADPLAALN